MAQRQFRSDDTSFWTHRFGSGKDGDLTISSNTTQSCAMATLTGTSGTKAGTLGAASTFSNTDLVAIFQIYGTGAGNWELNQIASGAGTTSVTMSYDFTNTYGTGAIMVEMKEYGNVTVNSGVALSPTGWDGSTGGVLALFANGLVSGAGQYLGDARGFRGGAQVQTSGGYQGEGTTNGAGSISSGANGNGGGGGTRDGGTNTGHSGAGGSNGTSGQNGPTHNEFSPAPGGNASAGSTTGNSGLTSMVLGGGGGAGGKDSGVNSLAGEGGDGGAIILIIGKRIDLSSGTGAISNGSNGIGNDFNHNGGGGGGAGGSILLKGQTVLLGSSCTALGGNGAWGCAMQHSNLGGNGGSGRIHIDYGLSVSGTTNPSADTRQDPVLNDAGGAAFFF